MSSNLKNTWPVLMDCRYPEFEGEIKHRKAPSSSAPALISCHSSGESVVKKLVQLQPSWCRPLLRQHSSSSASLGLLYCLMCCWRQIVFSVGIGEVRGLTLVLRWESISSFSLARYLVTKRFQSLAFLFWFRRPYTARRIPCQNLSLECCDI